MTFEEIEQCRQDLLRILNIDPEGKQHQPLRILAKKVGAQQPNARNVEFRDMIVNNINHALQTASMIEACRIAAENYKIALMATKASIRHYRAAAIIAIVSMLVASFITFKANETSRDANKIAFDTFQSSYVPWLSVTSMKPTLIDSNNFEVAIKCKNFSDAPALNLNIKYDILGATKGSGSYLYESNALMPNDERGLKMIGINKDGRAGEFVDKLNNGEFSLSFYINYEDIFGREIEIHQVRKWIMGDFRVTTYEVIKGLD